MRNSNIIKMGQRVAQSVRQKIRFALSPFFLLPPNGPLVLNKYKIDLDWLCRSLTLRDTKQNLPKLQAYIALGQIYQNLDFFRQLIK